MEIKLWGIRGSIPTPLSNEEYSSKIIDILDFSLKNSNSYKTTGIEIFNSLPNDLKYTAGGNTTCIEITADGGEKFIIDCGTGIRELGYQLMKDDCGKGNGNINLFMTHNHWDHIQGIPFFLPIYIPGNALNIYSPFANQEEIFQSQMKAPFFPANFDDTASTKIYHKLDSANPKPIKFKNGLEIDFYPLKHPGGSFAYRFKQNNKTFIFATDAEFTGEFIERPYNQTKFFNDADLLILDAQYRLDESFTKFDWGHTSYTMAVNCANHWKSKHLVLTHHEPSYSDNELIEILEDAKQHLKKIENKTMDISLAIEGNVYNI